TLPERKRHGDHGSLNRQPHLETSFARRRGADTGRLLWNLDDRRAGAVDLVRRSSPQRASVQTDGGGLRQEGRAGRLLDLVDDRRRAVDPDLLAGPSRHPVDAMWDLLGLERFLHRDGPGATELDRDRAVERAPG